MRYVQAAACKRRIARALHESSLASSAKYVAPRSSTKIPCRVSSFIIRVMILCSTPLHRFIARRGNFDKHRLAIGTAMVTLGVGAGILMSITRNRKLMQS